MWEIIIDTHVKNPFYMDSGIQEFRDCELFKGVTNIPILRIGELRFSTRLSFKGGGRNVRRHYIENRF